MSYSDLPGNDANGPTVWQRATSNNIRHGEQPTRIAPRRHRRTERTLTPLQAFLRRPRSVKSMAMSAARKKDTAHLQNVIVRSQAMRQPKPGSKRSWARFGRYLERDNASPERAGFTQDQDRDVPISDQLREWQKSGDEKATSVILSPENELDLKEFTRAWIARLERERGAKLQWVAAVHTNTDHAHVHLVLREKDQAGNPVQYSRSDLRERFRQHAREIATEFLGYRTQEPEKERGKARERSFSQDRDSIR